jgi:hypothetical protein
MALNNDRNRVQINYFKIITTLLFFKVRYFFMESSLRQPEEFQEE